jgi:hypothetical protein
MCSLASSIQPQSRPASVTALSIDAESGAPASSDERSAADPPDDTPAELVVPEEPAAPDAEPGPAPDAEPDAKEPVPLGAPDERDPADTPDGPADPEDPDLRCLEATWLRKQRARAPQQVQRPS